MKQWELLKDLTLCVSVYDSYQSCHETLQVPNIEVSHFESLQQIKTSGTQESACTACSEYHCRTELGAVSLCLHIEICQ